MTKQNKERIKCGKCSAVFGEDVGVFYRTATTVICGVCRMKENNPTFRAFAENCKQLKNEKTK